MYSTVSNVPSTRWHPPVPIVPVVLSAMGWRLRESFTVVRTAHRSTGSTSLKTV
ncbi:MAG TPA: hypothetical protein VNA23_11765 [Anaerolineales bacterium]|nr:hypothetical protein [Anaerolineales bacterium]